MRVAIIGAMENEVEKFKEKFNLHLIEENLYIGEYMGKELIVTKSGIGKVNSAAITQHLIDTYKVDYIINTGCAGSLVKDISLFETIISSYVTYHDFEPERIMKISVPDEGCVKSDPYLIEIAQKALKELNYSYQIKPLCSGDSFVTNDKQRDQIYQKTKAIAVDMESASIGHVSKKNKIPFVCIRTISDFADGVDEFEEKAAYKASIIVSKMIDFLL